MIPDSILTRFQDDNRAVAPIIGVIILFGFFTIALAGYQAQAVPQQNAETEFQHSGEVRNDLVDLRRSILQAGSTGQQQYQTVQLGTSYSTRLVTINPPSPAGEIRTSESYPITIKDDTGDTIATIPTRFIEYRPGYNELDRSPTWYDASVLYLDARDEGGGIAVIEDQTLVDDGKVQITALQNEFRKSGTGSVTLELRPAESVITEIEGDLTVIIPTQLNETDWRIKTDLPTDSGVYAGVDKADYDNSNNKDIYNLTLNTNAEDLTVNRVGVQGAPEDSSQNSTVRIGSADDGNVDSSDGSDGSGAGQGGVSDYKNTKKETFSTENGLWENITDTDQMILSNGKPKLEDDKKEIELKASLRGDDEQEYIIEIELKKEEDEWDEKEVKIINLATEDDKKEELTDDAARRIFKNGESDIFDFENYNDPDEEFKSLIEAIQGLSKPVEWQTTEMNGRVDVELK